MFHLPHIKPQRMPHVLRNLPKAELHVHIEGTLTPELMLRLAQRNGVVLPWSDPQAVRAAYAFTDLQSFLDVYYTGASVLQHEQDFFDLAWEHLQRAAADQVVHTEMFFDPQTHTARGVPIGHVIQGLHHACQRAHQEFGLSAQLILCFLRHLSEDEALDTLEAALPWRSHFIGVGLDSSELGHPPEKFGRVFARCRELGLHVVAHAGEEGPPAYIWSALDVLKAERIDHGVQAEHDPVLLQHLAQQRIPLTVCPLSNVRLGVFPDLAQHNLRRLLEAGVCVTINSDDPAYFGGGLNDNWLQVFEALDLQPRHAYQLAFNSFEASFVDGPIKRAWERQLKAYFEGLREHD